MRQVEDYGGLCEVLRIIAEFEEGWYIHENILHSPQRSALGKYIVENIVDAQFPE